MTSWRPSSCRFRTLCGQIHNSWHRKSNVGIVTPQVSQPISTMGIDCPIRISGWLIPHFGWNRSSFFAVSIPLMLQRSSTSAYLGSCFSTCSDFFGTLNPHIGIADATNVWIDTVCISCLVLSTKSASEALQPACTEPLGHDFGQEIAWKKHFKKSGMCRDVELIPQHKL